MRNLTIATLVLLCAPFANAQRENDALDCRTIEYAELKDMSKDDLLRTYCGYDALMRINYKAFERMQPHDAAEANAYRHQGAQCGTEAVRIFKVLQKYHNVPDKGPDCEALKKVWAEENKKANAQKKKEK